MEAKIEKTSELSKLLSVKTRMSDDLFHPFDKFGIGHLLSRLSLEKTWRGLGFASNLLTCPLVDSSTYHVTLSFIYPVYKQLVHLSTRWLVHLPCYSVFYLPCLQATGLLVHSLTCPLAYFSTKKLHNLAFSINFAIFANCLIHMYHMFVEIIDISYYEFKL